MSDSELDIWLATIPEAVRARCQEHGVREVGFRAGPSYISGEDKHFDPPAELEDALAWLLRYRHVMRAAHLRLEQAVLWFHKDGFSRLEERAGPVEPAGVVVDHRAANALENAHARLNGPEYAEALAQLARVEEGLGAFSADDTVDITDALGLMLELHGEQAPRPDGEPYVSHTLDVAAQVVAELGIRDRDVVIAALLHDAVEDQAEALAAMTSVDAPDVQARALAVLRERFGERVAELVSHLTNPDFEAVLDAEGIVSGDDRRARKNALYLEHVRELAEAEPDAFAIKLCDLRCNALRLDRVEDERRRARLRDKYRPVVVLMIEVLEAIGDDHPLWPSRDRLLDELRDARAARADGRT